MLMVMKNGTKPMEEIQGIKDIFFYSLLMEDMFLEEALLLSVVEKQMLGL